jgi:hypothetical protein
MTFTYCASCKALVISSRPFARCWLNGKEQTLHFVCIGDFLKTMGAA